MNETLSSAFLNATTMVMDILNESSTVTVPLTSTASTTTTILPHNGLTFREDGVREPPLFTEANNVIIMILGLSILIIPVVGFLVCMCAKSTFLRNLRGMQLISCEGGSGLPYSQFDEEDTYETVIKGKKHNNNTGHKDVRVLLNNDNTVVGSPKRCGDIKGQSNKSQGGPDYATLTLDVDATFVLPREDNSSGSSSYS